jgi:hypothetical protein
MKKLLTAGLSIVTAIAPLSFPLEANAIPFQSNTVYRALNNGSTVVVFSGAPAGTATITVKNSSPTSRIVGACGEIRLSPAVVGPVPLANVTVNNSQIDTSNLQTFNIPLCENGVFSPSVPTNFRTPQGGIVLGGRTPGTAVSVIVPRDVARTITLNSCGFGILRNPGTSVNMNGTNTQVSTLPNAGQAPRCIDNIGYVPTTFIP